MSLENMDEFAVNSIPDPYSAIPTRRSNETAGVINGNSEDLGTMPREQMVLLAAGQVPQAQGAIVAARQNLLAIRMKRYSTDGSVMIVEALDLASHPVLANTPQHHGVVKTTSQDATALRFNSNRPNWTTVANQMASGLERLCIIIGRHRH